jgi:hypothetical protein
VAGTSWTVAVTVLVLTKCLGRRRIVCANLILADSRLALEQQDLFTANQVIHLKPIVGDELLDDFLAANPFVRRLYPNALAWHPHRLVDLPERGLLPSLKRGLELVLALPRRSSSGRAGSCMAGTCGDARAAGDPLSRSCSTRTS